MKTYEEMARGVLRRRDEQLASITQTPQLQSQINPPPEVVYPAAPKKRGKLGLLPKIAIPCAAAVLVGAVGLTAWNNLHRGRFINPGLAEGDQTGVADDDESKLQYIFNEFDSTPTHTAAEEPESIYKGGKTEIYINEVEEWKFYPTPELLAEDFRPIDDDKINNYYGLEFDRLSRVFPEWESLHEPFGVFEHDEDDGFVVSHGLIYNLNRITYTTKDGDIVDTAASLRKYDTATIENAKPSVINGFDAMVYSCISNGDRCYAADIEMGHSYVTIKTINVDEEEFLNILDVYTAPDEGGEDNRNNDHNQTMEDKIVVYNGRPDFIMDEVPFELNNNKDLTNCKNIRYSGEQLNALYGINFTCLDELHPEWTKWYDERSFAVYVRDYPSIAGEDMAVSGGREIVSTRNEINYLLSENERVTVIACQYTLPETDIEHSVVNGYDAIIFLYKDTNGNKDFGAAIDMDGTLVCITAVEMSSADDFVDLLREYTSEASKYNKHSNTSLEPAEFAEINAVDPFDSRITYSVDWGYHTGGWWTNTYDVYGLWDLRDINEDAETSLGRLKEFFGTDKLPVDEQYKGDFTRQAATGYFHCHTAVGAKAYSPVDGKVVGASGGYTGGIGKAVAVEFGDGKIFIIGHLDEVHVKVGDTVKAGDTLGVSGQTGMVMYDELPKVTIIPMIKTD